MSRANIDSQKRHDGRSNVHGFAEQDALDLLAASWFVRENLKDFRYSYPRKCWYVRRPAGWARAPEDELRKRIFQTMKSITAASWSIGKGGAANEVQRQRLRRCVAILQERDGQHQMIKLARRNQAIQTDLFIEAEIGNK